MFKINKYLHIAGSLHGNQKYGKHPYSKHLQDVDHVLTKFEIKDEDIRQAGTIHDVPEDVENISKEDLIKLGFSERAVELAYLLKDGPGKNRKERKAHVYPKLQKDEDATILKLADRIANISYSIETNNVKKTKMYLKEDPEFVEKLQDNAIYKVKRKQTPELWKHYTNLITHAQEITLSKNKTPTKEIER